MYPPTHTHTHTHPHTHPHTHTHTHTHSNLELLLSTRSYRVKLLPASLSEIFVPLINALDYLLVIGGIEGDGDVERMLELLDPRLFSSSSKHGEGG